MLHCPLTNFFGGFDAALVETASLTKGITTKTAVVYDVEIYENYFLVAFRSLKSGKVQTFELSEHHTLDRKALKATMLKFLTIGFNSNTFDRPLIWMAINGYTVSQIKKAANKIILEKLRSWDVESAFGFKMQRHDTIDLIEVAPGQASLKIYAGRRHIKRLQDLPIEPDAVLTREQMRDIKDYCVNGDLNATIELFKGLKEQIELRVQMGKQYGEDLRSKSDAQIAEAVIKKQIEKLKGYAPKRPETVARIHQYRVPVFLKFETPQLQNILEEVRKADFEVAGLGKVLMPKVLEKARITIGNTIYNMGVGGLHSTEGTMCHVADDDTILADRDVVSYYPAIILNLGLFPKQLGKEFLNVYRAIRDRRLKAKANGEKSIAESLKIVINGSFGKFGSRWSVLYSPDLLIQVTVTGQLSLLMLIERLELAGIPVVSANTDGIVIKCPKTREGVMLEVVKSWEADTGFVTEETRYRALYSRDVNNYLAVKPDGKTKGKGAFAPTGWQKNPVNEICVEAATQLIVNGTPIEKTIRECKDIRKFITIITVQGGAIKDGEYIGRAIRWYYAIGETGAIHRKIPNQKGNHNKVPRTDGARLMMEFTDEFPEDLDFQWYITETREILADLGFFTRPHETPLADALKVLLRIRKWKVK